MNRKEALDKKLLQNPFLVLENAIFELLSEDIIQLRILPGTRLNEQLLAEEFGTSRTPVRNALNKLIDDRLLEREKGKPPVVSHMTMQESKRLYEARIAIEPYAAFLAADRITDEEIAHLKELTKQYRETVYTTDASSKFAHAMCDHQFHLAIIHASQNPFIINMYASIEKQILHYRSSLLLETEFDSLSKILQQAVRHHESICYVMEHHLANTAFDEVKRDIAGMLDVFPAWKQ
ncbi:FCD domain-containing protein [Anaerotignum sp.]